MVSHLECAAATVWETAILISIRLCLSSLSTHKSLLQSEINSYWSALISQVRHEGICSDWNQPSLTAPKTSFCLWNSGVLWSFSTADTDRENDGVWSITSLFSRSANTHTHMLQTYTWCFIIKKRSHQNLKRALTLVEVVVQIQTSRQNQAAKNALAAGYYQKNQRHQTRHTEFNPGPNPQRHLQHNHTRDSLAQVLARLKKAGVRSR